MTVQESDDEQLGLSLSALDALKEFYAERDAREKAFAELQAEAERIRREAIPLTMEPFVEDWNKSQFWYSDKTATLYAKQLLQDNMRADSTIAVVSAPSAFIALKNLLNAAPAEQPRPKVVLLEHDHRFEIFPEFVFYDVMQPFKLPAELKGTADAIICDPPFLSEDCQTKAALTVRWLAKPITADATTSPKVILSTGERVGTLVTAKLYKSFGLRTTTYEPVHARGLSNEFYCYANFEASDGSWTWKTE
ncbi:putative N6-adenine methyltransferase-domain-containing protein [Apodospora peruviana]|uniref:Protein-lysine N-methyltransferase EFM5 n=1 Tax=Apodospora peruviana TaxID=516989 RepID=A0AAE0M011_9PEZI|nr:putative N6-adenine methyltransferase-domain-containing protein [Apodospora peruviana]